jgi:hypothetical protein
MPAVQMWSKMAKIAYRFEGMTKVTFAAGVNNSTPQDTRLTSMEAENAEMKAQLKVLQAKLQGDTSGTKLNRNGKPVDKKTVPGLHVHSTPCVELKACGLRAVLLR